MYNASGTRARTGAGTSNLPLEKMDVCQSLNPFYKNVTKKVKQLRRNIDFGSDSSLMTVDF